MPTSLSPLLQTDQSIFKEKKPYRIGAQCLCRCMGLCVRVANGSLIRGRKVFNIDALKVGGEGGGAGDLLFLKSFHPIVYRRQPPAWDGASVGMINNSSPAVVSSESTEFASSSFRAIDINLNAFYSFRVVIESVACVSSGVFISLSLIYSATFTQATRPIFSKTMRLSLEIVRSKHRRV